MNGGAFSAWLLLFLGIPACLSVEDGRIALAPDGEDGEPPRGDDIISQLLSPEEEPSTTIIPWGLQVKFMLHTPTDPENKGCYLMIGQDQHLELCKFNVSAKSFFIIHGWTMSGMFDSWMDNLVSAVWEREKLANVVVVDWLPLAHQLYTNAVNNTRVAGKEVAKMLDWLQEKEGFRLKNVHLIGYSLGAHVAGFAGNYVHGTLGRITGLDPAGPMFEGVEPNRRLSPDDADFVDVLHTYTRETLGISIGIQMPVGHIDIYPNGGDSQPGCGFGDVLGALAYGNIADAVKCEHERSVHLFVDSLVNKDKQSFAFLCTDSGRFKKGICLSCRKNRCNSIGYNAKKMKNKRNSKMYLKTRAGMPFKVFHYQMKMHVFSYKNMGEMEPTFSVTLHGTSGDSQPLPLEMYEQIGLNYTNSFLVYTEEEVGDILKIKLTWEGSTQTWYSLWRELKSYWSQPENSTKELHVRRIRVKSGETQQNDGCHMTTETGDTVGSLVVNGDDHQAPRVRPDWLLSKGNLYLYYGLWNLCYVNMATPAFLFAPTTIVFGVLRLTFCVEDFQATRISPGQELWFVKCREGWQKKNESISALNSR